MTVTVGIPRSTPILDMIGRRINAATVWDTNVAIVPANKMIQNKACQGESRGRATRIP